jgi:hypothetical protein
LLGSESLPFVNGLHGDKLPFKFDMKRLPSEDAHWAVAKTPIKAEERIEIAPALVLPLKDIEPLAPLTIQWMHLAERHHTTIRKMREDGQLRVIRRNGSTKGPPNSDGFESFETTAILPFAGNMGLIRRVGSDTPKLPLNH